MRPVLPLTALALTLAFPLRAHAETYRLGTSAAADHRQLAELPTLAPGDVVELEGDLDYAGGHRFEDAGSQALPIIIRGVGGRPRIAGGANTIEAAGNHYVFENLDISGGTSRCFFHHADDITIRDSVVHDCPRQGILGADNDSGSILLERVEVHHCGGGDRDHQIYMATDEDTYPGSVFRMQFCWIHDANGGNNVKSRAERNEIYFNWIEGAYYHELELIGPDPAGGIEESTAREDSDVVGNVFVKRGSNETFPVVRFGGDGTGQSLGRYRFAFNTVVVAPGSTSSVFRLFSGLESVEMHSNVFVMRGGGGVNLLREAEAEWTSGRAIAGGHNWVPTGSTNVPSEWIDTTMGSDPALTSVALSTIDLRPLDGSTVIDSGLSPPATFAAHPFPRPLDRPASSPLHDVGGIARPVVGVIDRGAYEFGSGTLPEDAGVADAGGMDAGGIDAGSPAPDGGPTLDAGERDAATADAGGEASGAGCGCRAQHGSAPIPLALMLAALLVFRRQRPRAACAART
jgi:MYXO-CTERM domain-containing protein